jgi:hypothetical protein
MYHFNFAPSNYSNRNLAVQGMERPSRITYESPASSLFKSTMHPDGSATTETDGYLITVRPGSPQAGGTVTVFNKKTGKEQEHIWGDPHSSGGEFRGTMTMVLDGNIKISTQTRPLGNATLADVVTVTDGHNGVQYSGVSSGALTARLADGRRLDRSVPDGMVLHSTPEGLRGRHGEVVNQQYMNTHDVQLNPWLADRPDIELPGSQSEHRQSFESHRSSSRDMEAAIHRHLQNFLARLQATLPVNGLQIHGRFSHMPDAPIQQYTYQDAVGWSTQYAQNPFMTLQVK